MTPTVQARLGSSVLPQSWVKAAGPAHVVEVFSPGQGVLSSDKTECFTSWWTINKPCMTRDSVVMCVACQNRTELFTT